MKRAIFTILVSASVLAFGMASFGSTQVHAVNTVHLANGRYKFRLNANTHYCISSPNLNHLVDQQLTVSNRTSCAIITVKSVPHTADDKFLSVAGGHCLYKNAQQTDIKVSRNVCVATNQDEQWTPTASFPFRLMNDSANVGGWLRVRWLTPGSRVSVGNRGYNNWKLVPVPSTLPTVR